VAETHGKGVLVLITGTGRSGTSTISGSLHHLGLHVPGPHLGANESNPKGFYESKWAVKFHKQLATAAGINDMDSRPTALGRVQTAITPEAREQLAEFLGEHAAQHSQVVVKDPRSVWAQRLWKEAAAEVGLDIRYLSMLRHPAEVVGSRTTYYAKPDDAEQRRRYETFNVARWVNNSIISERETRGEIRTFVGYGELLEDWRPVLARVRDELGLTFNTDLAPGTPHPVDDFIDPSLRRHKVEWDDLEVPGELQALAQSVWDEMMILRESAGVDPAASERLDSLGLRYSRLFLDAAAISHDATEEATARARRQGERAALKRKAAKPAKPAAPKSPDDRPVGQVGGRELIRIIGRRAARKVGFAR
jgi:hypothetical protein